jgi:aminoglycoside phosphotransferase family enzyme
MNLPGIEEKVAFLSSAQAYPGCVQRVEVKQTHMSWVFLTNTHAWKLKKPVKTADLDFSTIEARRRNCIREVRLNRRLARTVYQGVVPLTLDNRRNLQLHGQGKTVDWLVRMRRLPSELMLDAMIARRAVTESDIAKLAFALIEFYGKARRISITGSCYRKRLATGLESARHDLTRGDCGTVSDLANRVIERQLAFMSGNRSMFDGRALSGRLIEAHGDLRPEHVCLEPHPVIIDCLEFNKRLRTLDVVSELAFLALECETLGAPEIGEFILGKYSRATGDEPPPVLMAFYRAFHACIRAKLAILHLRDNGIRNQTWIAKADRYLSMVAEPVSQVA